MCIRDRGSAAGGVFLGNRIANVAVLLASAAAGAFLMVNGPVSYTHLRAHETVLDLVCRLLLEKKKK